MRDYAVFQLRIAHELCKMGYILTRVCPDRNNPRYNVYYFRNENGIEEVIKKLAAKRK